MRTIAIYSCPIVMGSLAVLAALGAEGRLFVVGGLTALVITSVAERVARRSRNGRSSSH